MALKNEENLTRRTGKEGHSRPRSIQRCGGLEMFALLPEVLYSGLAWPVHGQTGAEDSQTAEFRLHCAGDRHAAGPEQR